MGGSDGHDAVVAGASLAGCAAAILLAREGAQVALVERSPDPAAHRRACTHLIQSSAVPVIARLGLLEPMTALGAAATSVHISTPWGVVPQPVRDGEPVFGRALSLRRERLDPLIRGIAAETPGVELIGGLTVTSLIEESGRAAGLVAAGPDGAERRIPARLVVGADGRDSAVARLAGIETRSRENRRFCYFAHWEGIEGESRDSSSIRIGPGLEVAYSFPTDSGLTVLAAFPMHDELPRFKRDPEGALVEMLAPLGPPFDPRGARRASPVTGRIDMPNLSRRPAGAGVALVGDATLAADPTAGVGCGWALQSAEWLAEEAGAAVRGDEPLDPALGRYARTHRARLAGHADLIARGSLGNQPSTSERLVYGAAARDPGVAERLHGYASRNLPPRVLYSPATLARTAVALLGRRRRASGG
ncbi:MAG TPA: NAD(P)/FAD-dependent oxidoreductase [Thermoleophilaceae bacterium]|nr:NAD(P)/FAD-dependent oxidoreductase [Thermoleophilaceae bacterium]